MSELELALKKIQDKAGPATDQDALLIRDLLTGSQSAFSMQLDHQRSSANDHREFWLKIVLVFTSTVVALSIIFGCLHYAPESQKMEVINSLVKVVTGAIGGLTGGFALGREYGKK